MKSNFGGLLKIYKCIYIYQEQACICVQLMLNANTQDKIQKV